MKGTVQTEPCRTTDGRAEQEYVSPDVNIVENKDGYVLEAEMPGVSKEGLEVTLEGNEMTIVGHRQDEAVTGTPLFRERKLLDFRRVFELDPTIDTARIAAKMAQGVLSLTLPKSEKVKPRKVTID
jgi:HSP20 family protein